MKRKALVSLVGSLVALVFVLAFGPVTVFAETGDALPDDPRLVEAEANAFDFVRADVALDPCAPLTADGGDAPDAVQNAVDKVTEACESLTTYVYFDKGTFTVADFNDAIGLIATNP